MSTVHSGLCSASSKCYPKRQPERVDATAYVSQGMYLSRFNLGPLSHIKRTDLIQHLPVCPTVYNIVFNLTITMAIRSVHWNEIFYFTMLYNSTSAVVHALQKGHTEICESLAITCESPVRK